MCSGFRSNHNITCEITGRNSIVSVVNVESRCCISDGSIAVAGTVRKCKIITADGNCTSCAFFECNTLINTNVTVDDCVVFNGQAIDFGNLIAGTDTDCTPLLAATLNVDIGKLVVGNVKCNIVVVKVSGVDCASTDVGECVAVEYNSCIFGIYYAIRAGETQLNSMTADVVDNVVCEFNAGLVRSVHCVCCPITIAVECTAVNCDFFCTADVQVQVNTITGYAGFGFSQIKCTIFDFERGHIGAGLVDPAIVGGLDCETIDHNVLGLCSTGTDCETVNCNISFCLNGQSFGNIDGFVGKRILTALDNNSVAIICCGDGISNG